MHDESTSVDLSSGFNRRSALKKAAVAGAVVWTAPVLLSDSAQAVQLLPGGCTAKCAPIVDAVDLVVTGSKGACDDTAPGQVIREFNITSVTLGAASGSCPCGGAEAVVTFTPETITYIDPLGNQGNRTDVNVGSVSVTFGCTDRVGNTIETTCEAQILASFSGSCQGVGNTTFSVGALVNCSTVCLTAAD
jgi:hypothetical protein